MPIPTMFSTIDRRSIGSPTVPLDVSDFTLDTSGVAGVFGGDEAVSAMATVHVYENRRWLGWYNSPGSYQIAKRYGLLAKSRFFGGFFPGVHTDPATSELDGRKGSISRRASICFGDTGVGKSSLINLIYGKEIAQTAPDVQGCTTSPKRYDIDLDDQEFDAWDTVGLEVPKMGGSSGNYLRAIEQSYELIRNLESRGSTNLLLHCIRGDQNIETIVKNHRLFYEVLGKSQIPISLVVTHLEQEADMEDWWLRNEKTLRKYGVEVAGHACVTTLPTHPKYEESRAKIRELLMQGRDGDGRFSVPQETRSIRLLRRCGLLFRSKTESKADDLVKALTKRCKMDQRIAEELADRLKGKGWN